MGVSAVFAFSYMLLLSIRNAFNVGQTKAEHPRAARALLHQLALATPAA